MIFYLPLAKQSGSPCICRHLESLEFSAMQGVVAYNHSFSTQRVRQEDLEGSRMAQTFNSTCMSALRACMFVYHVLACCTPRPGEDIGFPVIGVTDGCELAIGPLEEQRCSNLLNLLSISFLANLNVLFLSLAFWRSSVCLGLYLSVSHWRFLGIWGSLISLISLSMPHLLSLWSFPLGVLLAGINGCLTASSAAAKLTAGRSIAWCPGQCSVSGTSLYLVPLPRFLLQEWPFCS